MWRLRAYSRPGLPRPTTSRSSDDPWRRGQSRIGASPRRARIAGGVAVRFGRRLGVAFRLLALGRASPSTPSSPSSAADFLGLDLARRRGHGRDDGLGIVEERHALLHDDVGDAERVARRHVRDVEVDVLRDFERQRLDLDLAQRLREHAALLHARRVVAADQVDATRTR